MNKRMSAALAALVILLVGVTWSATRQAAGSTGAASASVASPFASTGALDGAIARFAKRAEEDPYSAGDRAVLGKLYLQRARESGSFEDVLRAEELARRSLELRPQRNSSTYGVLSLSLMEQHRFTEALDAARRMLAADPESVAARAHLAEIHLELGDYDRAAAIFQSLEAERDDLDVAPRAARWLEVTGRSDEARALLYAARERSRAQNGLSGERAAWYDLRLGDLELRHGRLAEAEEALKDGLAAFPGDYRILAAMARLESARGDYAASLRYGEAVLGRLLDPGVLIVMSDAALAAGDSAKAAEYEQVLQVAAEGQKTAYHRDWGLFFLDRGVRVDQVAERARLDLETRRDIYGYDLLAWAHHRQGRHAEAREAMRLALRTGARDALLLYHAGMIEHALGDDEAAASYLSRALRENPRFHPAHAATARRTLDAIRGPWYRRIGRGDV